MAQVDDDLVENFTSAFNAEILSQKALDWLNPWELTALNWFKLWAIKAVLIVLWDTIIEWFFGRLVFGGVLLGSRDTDTFKKNKAKNRLQTIDYVFLFINSFIEMVFVFNLFKLGRYNSDILWYFKDLTVWNTVVASVALIMIDDAIYAPVHRFLHWKPIYPLIHKHHHRQKFPERGYLDAGNEHPIEQIIGLSIIYGSILIVGKLFNMHISSLALTFVYYAFVNVVNHTSYDIQLNYFGFLFQYTVGAHEMHHRFFNCNYGKSCMWFDVLMGTFEPYSKGKRPKKATKLT